MSQAKLNPAVTAASGVAVLWLASPFIAFFVGLPLLISLVAFWGVFIEAWPVTIPIAIWAAVKGTKKLFRMRK